MYGLIKSSKASKLNSMQETIGERVKRLRESKGLSQSDLAKLTDLTAAYIGSLERGEDRYSNPTITTIESLARGLKVHASEITFGFSPEEKGAQFEFLIDANNQHEVMNAAAKFEPLLPLSKDEREDLLDMRACTPKQLKGLRMVLHTMTRRKK